MIFNWKFLAWMWDDFIIYFNRRFRIELVVNTVMTDCRLSFMVSEKNENFPAQVAQIQKRHWHPPYLVFWWFFLNS